MQWRLAMSETHLLATLERGRTNLVLERVMRARACPVRLLAHHRRTSSSSGGGWRWIALSKHFSLVAVMKMSLGERKRTKGQGLLSVSAEESGEVASGENGARSAVGSDVRRRRKQYCGEWSGDARLAAGRSRLLKLHRLISTGR